MSGNHTTTKDHKWDDFAKAIAAKATVGSRDTLVRTFTIEIKRRKDEQDDASTNKIFKLVEDEHPHDPSRPWTPPQAAT